MALPLLNVRPTTQNVRVPRYFVPGDETPNVNRLDAAADPRDVARAIYRQLFSEHLMLDSFRQSTLESQLNNRSISVREFVRGLGKSSTYRDLVMDPNNNYQFIEITFQRFLGRATYNQEERIAYSIVLATKGLDGFIDAIVDSPEYLEAFGDDMVPHQRRRLSESPTNLQVPRYSSNFRIRSGVGLRRTWKQVVQSYRTPVAGGRSKTGDPMQFLEMARTISPKMQQRQRIGAFDVKIPDMTTERR